MAEAVQPLVDRAAAALAWRFSARAAAFVLRLTVLVVLARLVSVESFGVFSQTIIIIGLAALVAEVGIAPALIQRPNLNETHIRVAFTVAGLNGVLITILVWAAAPLVALFYRTPEVTAVLRLVAFTFLFTALGTTARALLERRLAFRQLFLVELTSYALGYGVVGISLAILGFGVWALAWAPIVDAVVQAILLYRASPHSVRPSLARPELRQLFRFGFGMMLSRLANYTAQTSDNFVVGRQLGAAALGLYARAYQLMTLPMSEFSEVLGAVLFPAYAEIQSEAERLRRAALATISLAALVVFPLLATLAITAPELVVGVLGPSWAGAVLPLQILCVGGFFRAIYSLGDSVARARGAVYAQSWRKVVFGLCVIVGAAIGCLWGIAAVAGAVVAALVIIYLLMAQLQIRLIGASWRDFFGAQLAGLSLAVAVTALGLPVAVLLRGAALPPLAVLAITIACCLLAAVSTGFLLPRRWHDQRVLETLGRILAGCTAKLKGRWLNYWAGRTSNARKRSDVNESLHGRHSLDIECKTAS